MRRAQYRILCGLVGISLPILLLGCKQQPAANTAAPTSPTVNTTNTGRTGTPSGNSVAPTATAPTATPRPTVNDKGVYTAPPAPSVTTPAPKNIDAVTESQAYGLIRDPGTPQVVREKLMKKYPNAVPQPASQ